MAANLPKGDSESAIIEAKMKEREMIEKVRERIDPAIHETWRTFSIYLSAYINPQDLNSCDDFIHVFENLKTNNYIIFGSYEPLINILHNCDVPSEREVRTFQDQINRLLPKEELDKIEAWKNENKSGSPGKKSAADLEADMIKFVNGRVGPGSKRTWESFKNCLEIHISKAEVKRCSDVADAFQVLMQRGKIRIGEYKIFIDILTKCDVPSKNECLTYEERIKESLKAAETEFDQAEQNESKPRKRRLENGSEASTGDSKGEKVQRNK